MLSQDRWRFAVTADDGVRLYIDRQLVLNAWIDQPPTTYRVEVDLPAGSRTGRMEYYENGGGGEGKRDGRAMEPVREACEFPAPARKRRFLHRAYTLRIGSFLLRHDRAPEPAQRKRRPFQARSASITAGEEEKQGLRIFCYLSAERNCDVDCDVTLLLMTECDRVR